MNGSASDFTVRVPGRIKPVPLAWLRGLLVLVMLPCLLLVTLPPHSARGVLAIWNFGHVALFALLTQAVLAGWRQRWPLRWWSAVLLVPGMALFGGLIEGLQALIGRDCEWQDVLADTLGAGAGLLFSGAWRTLVSRRLCRMGWVLGALLLIGGGRDVLLQGADAVLRERHFPVLYAADAWLATRARLGLLAVTVTQVQLTSVSGRSLLQVDLQPARYSTLSIDEMQKDWRGYQTLAWRWYNPGEALDIGCRAHDRQHEANGYVDDDRYNEHFVLASGWTTLVIPLERIRNAPAQRQIDLGNMSSVACFAHDLALPRRLYLDWVMLEPP